MSQANRDKFVADGQNELAAVLIETYSVNDAMNQLLLNHLDPRAWRAKTPGPRGNGRTIGAIFAHLHNSRLVWLRHSAPHLKCPAPLKPEQCTMKQAAKAHRKSAAQCLRMLTDALSGGPERRVTKFSRGSWVPVWPAGGAMFSYMFSHEAHHRGQIIMLAHQLGYRLPPAAWGGIWQWNKLWREAGWEGRPR
ncbi:MAG TPA: DinB family protein [Candidatus Sulfotelmatobacter sp.]|nr:DinB family protein [Candidatus Sulfotelmatobacter sp.]